MRKPDLGTKRLCTECGAKYYDLNTTPITCPTCGARFRVVATTTPPRPAPRAAVREPVAVPRKMEPTSPEPPDTLIEELDEDTAEVSEIVGVEAKHEGET
jgi:uncharacterized protein (TIGR02300 family)